MGGAACLSLIVEAVGMVGRWFVGVEDGTGRNRWPLWAFCCCLGAAYPSACIKASRGVPVAHGGCSLIPLPPAWAWVLPVVSALPSLRLSRIFRSFKWGKAFRVVFTSCVAQFCHVTLFCGVRKTKISKFSVSTHCGASGFGDMTTPSIKSTRALLH